MKLLICMASIAPRKGGPSFAVRSMAQSLADAGHSVTIVAHDDGADGEVRHEVLPSYDIRRFRLSINRWELSAGYLQWVRKNLADFDGVLIHSLFLSHTFFVSRWARSRSIPYAIRPHGSLNIADLARRKWVKRVYLAIAERKTLRNAAFLFCTSDRERDEARLQGRVNPLVIPLGVEHEPGAAARRRAAGVDRSLVAFIGRLTEKKGIEYLIESVPLVLAKHGSARFVIAGPDDEGLKQRFEARVRELGVQESVQFVGFVDPQERGNLLSVAGSFVLPSRDENFGIGVAEALAAAVPVAITPGVSHAEFVKEYRAGAIIVRDPASIADGLSSIIGMDDDEYFEMCERAEALAHDKYSWEKSASLLSSAFKAVSV